MKEIVEPEQYLIKINLPGGIVAAGDLLEILNAAENAGIENLSLGNRQQLFLKVSAKQWEDLEQDFFISDVDYEIGEDKYPNIVSSYVSEDIFASSGWLREGVYKDILNLFDYKPRLKVNLTGNNQTFVPFFTGNLNYIASAVSNYWHLHLRFPKTNIFFAWPDLVYTEDIPALSRLIEESLLESAALFLDNEQAWGAHLYGKMEKLEQFAKQKPADPVILPDFELPYYEGFNKYDNKFWLGIYKRTEEYSIAFLKDICSVCLQDRIGQLYTTPWKSLIIKDIHPENRRSWNWILAKNRVNVRHASNELNWQVEDNCEYGLKLKHHLVNHFNKEDLRTFRLCFAIKINPKSGLFGSVVIKKQNAGPEGEQELFDILYTNDFNPNSRDFVTYTRHVTYRDLAGKLIELCDHFYTLQTDGNLLSGAENITKEEPGEEIDVVVHQCKNCLTVYDSIYGDDLNHIPAGTTFHTLPETWCCPTCNSAKSDFVAVSSIELGFLN